MMGDGIHKKRETTLKRSGILMFHTISTDSKFLRPGREIESFNFSRGGGGGEICLTIDSLAETFGTLQSSILEVRYVALSISRRDKKGTRKASVEPNHKEVEIKRAGKGVSFERKGGAKETG